MYIRACSLGQHVYMCVWEGGGESMVITVQVKVYLLLIGVSELEE